MVEKGKDSIYFTSGTKTHKQDYYTNLIWIFAHDWKSGWPKYITTAFLQGAEVPFFIWYDDYPEHASADFKGRVSKVQVGSQYGLASLILNDVKDTDRGWYNCKVLFLNREPNNAVVSHNNLLQGTTPKYRINVHIQSVFFLKLTEKKFPFFSCATKIISIDSLEKWVPVWSKILE